MDAFAPQHRWRMQHLRMIERLRQIIGDRERILAAFAAVPRHWFVDEALALRAYEDAALPIGAGQTISRPSTVARMLALLDLKGDERVLEIGAGSGYQTALLCRLAKRVYAIERIEALVARARRSLKRARCLNVLLQCADGTEGWPQAAPFDAIVSAACGNPPEHWQQQLRVGGVLVFPLPDPEHGARLARWRKTPEGWHKETFDPVRFVPLRQGVQ